MPVWTFVSQYITLLTNIAQCNSNYMKNTGKLSKKGQWNEIHKTLSYKTVEIKMVKRNVHLLFRFIIKKHNITSKQIVIIMNIRNILNSVIITETLSIAVYIVVESLSSSNRSSWIRSWIEVSSIVYSIWWWSSLNIVRSSWMTGNILFYSLNIYFKMFVCLFKRTFAVFSTVFLCFQVTCKVCHSFTSGMFV